ncbi:cilia- and flagella-associated protein 263-like [Clytia hemisphaerica]|uniref:cilia- and flagella-associated protein 263-like n=1 Tax=Clytia hemisphaerica TaxID=252671 RepID=UPI0034D3A5D0
MEEKIDENDQELLLKNEVCTPKKCIIRKGTTPKDTLTCRKCHQDVHYDCSELPIYQIQICLMFKSRSFQCQSCIKISPELIERVETCKNTKIEGLQKEIKACENIMKVQNEEISQLKSNDVNFLTKEIKESLETKMSILEKKIETKIENILIEKKQEAKDVSYAEAVSKQMNQKSNKVEKITRCETVDKQRSTACNLIFHGIKEHLEDPENTTKIYDEKFIKYRILGLQLGIKYIKIINTQRIGVFTEEREEEGRYRPIKVVLENEEDKNKVLRAITTYKGPPSSYRATEDLTIIERLAIKELCKRAHELNGQMKDKNIQFKVRGSPRTKLYLKKIVTTSDCKKTGS